MHGLIKNVYFWVLTAILLVVVGLSGLKIIPPLFTTYQQNLQLAQELETELTKQRNFLSAVNVVKQDESVLDELYDQASTALPSTPDNEFLLLQLDGLLDSLNLGSVKINVPIVSSKSDDKGAAPKTEIEATLSGPIDFPKSRNLLNRLRSFARWNKIKTFDITKSGDVYSTSIVFITSYKPGTPPEFSGNSAILDQAKELFAQFTSYATKPDSSSEGDFGKDNPFN